MTERNILDLFRREYDQPRDRHYFHFTPDGERVLSTVAFFERTAAFARGLEKLGIGRGDRVMLLSDNRPEWHLVDLAVADLGGVDVPVYGTLNPSQIAYQAKDSGARAAVVESPEQMAKFLEVREQCPELELLIQIEGPAAAGVVAMDEVVDSGAGGDAGDLFWQRASKVGADDVLTLIYTSGTTGNPKGVTLTHNNLVRNVLAAYDRAPIEPDDFGLEFLPLCHVFERMVGYLYMYLAVSKGYCSVYHVGDLVARIKPTVFAGVPRFYEKVYDKIMDKVGQAPPLRRALFDWALKAGGKAYPKVLAGKAPGGLSYALADKLVLSKVREGLGGRVRFCISGGAPLPVFVNEFFHSIGVRILEGYGLTETSPVIAVNGAAPGMTRIGTVGKAVREVEVRLAEDGELCVKGPNVMTGYWNLPDKTAEVFDADGFFLTGDIADIDADGFIRITDRKKDIIVTAGGKNVAPQPIENELKRSPLIDNAVLIGDRRPYIVALLSPNQEELERWAAAERVPYATIDELTRHPALQARYAAVIDDTNAALARYEQIKKFRVLPLMLSIDGGHLTPTLKVKRRVVEKDYVDLIEAMYKD
ncbi:MAG TPA: long-chain fatty acid--CoA ligase [Candidatus Sulfomarinibacteraceae bacterium]|nr:long-chain fatty acid--CoA ligase [Candidatus Sulfomarinibacteraceae bacterium]